jgi:hypothetical protein
MDACSQSPVHARGLCTPFNMVRILTVRILTVRILTVRILTVRILTVRILTGNQHSTEWATVNKMMSETMVARQCSWLIRLLQGYLKRVNYASPHWLVLHGHLYKHSHLRTESTFQLECHYYALVES